MAYLHYQILPRNPFDILIVKKETNLFICALYSGNLSSASKAAGPWQQEWGNKETASAL